MREHMSGEERAQWIGLSELRHEAREAAQAKARNEKPAIPHRSHTRSFPRRGRRR